MLIFTLEVVQLNCFSLQKWAWGISSISNSHPSQQ